MFTEKEKACIRIFLAIIALWVVNKLFSHTHPSVLEGNTNEDAKKEGIKDGADAAATGDNTPISNNTNETNETNDTQTPSTTDAVQNPPQILSLDDFKGDNCTCKNGKPIVDGCMKGENIEACESCNEGYIKEGPKCIPDPDKKSKCPIMEPLPAVPSECGDQSHFPTKYDECSCCEINGIVPQKKRKTCSGEIESGSDCKAAHNNAFVLNKWYNDIKCPSVDT